MSSENWQNWSSIDVLEALSRRLRPATEIRVSIKGTWRPPLQQAFRGPNSKRLIEARGLPATLPATLPHSPLAADGGRWLGYVSWAYPKHSHASKVWWDEPEMWLGLASWCWPMFSPRFLGWKELEDALHKYAESLPQARGGNTYVP